jgi:phytoene/squalene synthetase
VCVCVCVCVSLSLSLSRSLFLSLHHTFAPHSTLKYCHYVAGLVGIGLSKLFSSSGLEDAVVGADEATANSMGLFLQKTNIIRDYLEDLHSDRTWYPREVSVCVCVCVIMFA